MWNTTLGCRVAKDYFIDIPPESTRADARNAWANLIERITDERPPLWRFGDQKIYPVLLSELVSEMEAQTEGWSTFVNKQTSEIVGLPSDVFEFLDSGEDDDEYFGDAPKEVLEVGRQINNERDHYVALPDQFDIHEWAIMRKFGDSMDSAELRSELLAAIHGSGAFRHFKATVDRLDLRDDWFRFRDQAMERIAIEWLDDNEIPWARTKIGDALTPEE